MPRRGRRLAPQEAPLAAATVVAVPGKVGRGVAAEEGELGAGAVWACEEAGVSGGSKAADVEFGHGFYPREEKL